MADTTRPEKISMLMITFATGDSVRFLSHIETMRFFQRWLTRAEIPVLYSQGFNPRLKMSLPLPRSVGIKGEQELLCARVEGNTSLNIEKLSDKLKSQSPAGVKIISVEPVESTVIPQPIRADYIITIKENLFEHIEDRLKTDVQDLMGSDSIKVDRESTSKRGKHKRCELKQVDVRKYLCSIDVSDGQITVRCNITPEGTIRINEVMKLLNIETEQLAGPVRRANIQWRKK